MTVDVVVIGAGFAGAATAFQLTRLGVRDVVVLEREPVPGTHSSGRNAGLARQSGLSAAITPLAVEGTRLLREPSDAWRGASLLHRVGSLLLADETDAPGLQAAVRRGAEAGLHPLWLDPKEVERRVPLTAGGAFSGALWMPEDGVVDIAGLLAGYLRGAVHGGARLLTGQRVLGIEVVNGRVASVRTEGDTFVTHSVVNAAGAWAAEIAALAGALAIPLRPRRRHLYVSAPLAGVDRSWPYVWDISHGVYFRPEPPGLLLSACDETDHGPGLPSVDPRMAETLASKIERHLPALTGVAPARAWAGLRTLTPDGNFVVGRDPRVEGFVWCAGLGGHGMTTSAAVGRLAAEAVVGSLSHPDHGPERFIATLTANR